MSKTKKTVTLYLGFDGSYVLSRRRLVKAHDPSGVYDTYDGYYLSTSRPKHGSPTIVDIDETSGACVFKAFGLGKFDVVRLDVKVTSVGKAKRRT